jgi:hypothetical protein
MEASVSKYKKKPPNLVWNDLVLRSNCRTSARLTMMGQEPTGAHPQPDVANDRNLPP